jgi:4-amino-4-deoxy-L-arabinose transferase-like glycosyltransferase
MNRKPFQSDRFWTIGLLLAALLLYTVNLGELALRDWDEGTVAQVAREIWRAPTGSLSWLYPTIGGAPYLNKPPLIHWLIAITYQFGGVTEWTSRFPSALLTAISVPLLYGVGRELFPTRIPAIFAALVYLTMLPVVRHGRLAMLDGALLCFFLLLLLCLLRTRRNLRWSLGVGLAFGLLALTKGIAAILLGAIALGFVLLDTPRLLTTRFVWLGIGLGSLPAIAWYGAQGWHYGQEFFRANVLDQSLNRVWVSVENNRGAPWYYLWELLKYGLPWLLLLPSGLRTAWNHRNLSWARLTLVWAIGYLLVISGMSTKLPWYVLPIYPALALIIGAQLATVWQPEDALGMRSIPTRPYPILWRMGFALVAIVAWTALAYLSYSQSMIELQRIFAALAMTMTVVAVLLWQRNAQFVPVLFWGLYLSLLLLMLSHHWVWELAESYPVKPVAAIVKQHTPLGQTVLTSDRHSRPSLDFYSDRHVSPTSPEMLKTRWQQDSQPIFLVQPTTAQELGLESARLLGSAAGWVLITRQP